MAAISLHLPDDLALQSKQVAEKIGVSRTELIRQALRHELDSIEARFEREATCEPAVLPWSSIAGLPRYAVCSKKGWRSSIAGKLTKLPGVCSV